MDVVCNRRIEKNIVVTVAVQRGFGIPNDVGAGGNPAVQDYGHSVSHFVFYAAFCVQFEVRGRSYRQGQHR
jgi:hypothetical protein